MKKSELISKIKELAKEAYQKQINTKFAKQPSPSRFDLINKFPELIPVLTDLMTNDFEQFLDDIYWVAPKPTTFKIMLINSQYFFLTYDSRSWIVQVEGKKYYLEELRDLELASEAISRILKYGTVEKQKELSPEKKSNKKEKSPEENLPSGEEVITPETPPEGK